jgi:hypothetical protein
LINNQQTCIENCVVYILSSDWSVTIDEFGLVIGFIEFLQIVLEVIITVSLVQAFYSSLEHTLKSSQPAVPSPVFW